MQNTESERKMSDDKDKDLEARRAERRRQRALMMGVAPTPVAPPPVAAAPAPQPVQGSTVGARPAVAPTNPDVNLRPSVHGPSMVAAPKPLVSPGGVKPQMAPVPRMPLNYAPPLVPGRGAQPIAHVPVPEQKAVAPQALTIRVWVHTCRVRLDRLQPTLESIEASDIGADYEVLESPMWCDTPWQECEAWYVENMRRLASEPFIDGRPADLILRLEDDVIVNRHIIHNCRTWSAVRKPNFALGILFNWDAKWPPGPLYQDWDLQGNLRRKEPQIACAQGYLFGSGRVPVMFSDGAIQRGKQRLGAAGSTGPALYDIVTSDAAQCAGGVYSHLPSLVNCHEGCRVTADVGAPKLGNWSSKTFDLDWKRGESKPWPRL